jgi:hypothetical protein
MTAARRLLTGGGLEELLNRVLDRIPWLDLPVSATIATTVTDRHLPPVSANVLANCYSYYRRYSPVSASIATSSLPVLPISMIRLREVRLLLPALGSLLALPAVLGHHAHWIPNLQSLSH